MPTNPDIEANFHTSFLTLSARGGKGKHKFLILAVSAEQLMILLGDLHF
jgi:hypothetical protein